MNRTSIVGESSAVFEIASLIACVVFVVLLLAIGAAVLVRVLSRVRPKRAAATRKLHWFLLAAGLVSGPAAGLLYWAIWGWLGSYANEQQHIDDLWGFLEAGILVGVSGCVAMWLSNIALCSVRQQQPQVELVSAKPSYREAVVTSDDSRCFECLAVAGAE